MTIFVEDNYGNDYSEFHSIKIFGSPVMGTDVAAIKGQKTICILLLLLLLLLLSLLFETILLLFLSLLLCHYY